MNVNSLIVDSVQRVEKTDTQEGIVFYVKVCFIAHFFKLICSTICGGGTFESFQFNSVENFNSFA